MKQDTDIASWIASAFGDAEPGTYEAGFRAALESMVLALQGLPGSDCNRTTSAPRVLAEEWVIRDALQTVLEAFANNADLEERLIQAAKDLPVPGA